MMIMMIISFTLVSLGMGNVSANEDVQSGNEMDYIQPPQPSGNTIRTPAAWETMERVIFVNGFPNSEFSTKLETALGVTGASTTYVSWNDFIRNYGPMTIMNNGVREYNDPSRISEQFNPGAPRHDDFLSGGFANHIVDGAGILYSLKDNANEPLEAFGIHTARNFSTLPGSPPSRIPNIYYCLDMYVKLIDENTIILPSAGNNIDGDEEIFINALYNYFRNTARTRSGEKYNVFQIPIHRQYYTQNNIEYERLINYANSLIVNNHILIPMFFNNSTNSPDPGAYNTYVAAAAASRYNYEIEQVDTSDLLWDGINGYIHCATEQIAKQNAPPIIHDVEFDIEAVNGEFDVTIIVDIADDGEIEYADLYYYCSVDDEWKDVPLERQGMSDEYQATISSVAGGSELEYFIRAEDDDRAVSYYGDVWEPKSFELSEPHVNIYYPVQDQTLWGPSVTPMWESNTHPDMICHFSIRRRLGSGFWSGWINKGKNTYHTYTDMFTGQWEVQVEINTIDSQTDTHSVTFNVISGWGPLSIDSFEARDDSLTLEWSIDSNERIDVNHYEIRLNDGEWLNVGTRTRHTFTDLGDGRYVVTVRARDRAGEMYQDCVELVVGKG